MLNELRDECHKNAVDHGFWEVVGDDGVVIKDGEEKNTFPKCMALVVSEIGDTWSPYTAPPSTAAIVNKTSGVCEVPTTLVAIGTRIPNVPQLVPVAKEIAQAIKNRIAGINAPNFSAETFASTNALASNAPPFAPIIALSVHANVKIRIAGTIDLKPSEILLIHSLKGIALKLTKRIIVSIKAMQDPIARLMLELQLPNA